MQYLESDSGNFEIYSVTNRKPVDISKNRRNVAKARFLGNNPSKCVLNKLQASQIRNRCDNKERVTVVESRTHYRPLSRIHPSNPRCRYHVESGVGFCDNQNGLLQLHSGSTSSVVNRSSATGPECSRQTHHWHRNTRAHHSSASESALAPSKVSHNVQTGRTHASGAYRPCSCLPV